MSMLKYILLVVALVCTLLALLGEPCGAAPRALLPGPDPAREFLSPRPITPPQALVAAATRLQGTQVAMERMTAAGYVRTPQFDGAQSSPGRAFVALSYSDPGDPQHAPLVMVASDAISGPAHVWIGGAVFTIDPATGHLVVAGDAPEDDAFVITGETVSTDRSARIVTTTSVRSVMMNYLACAIPACGAGAGTCAIGGALLGPLAPPAVGGCVLALCGIAAYACLW